MFSIPTDHPEGLDQALLILKDWLCGITIAPEEVEGEKGIILEEERGYDTGDVFYDLKVKTPATAGGCLWEHRKRYKT